MSCHWLLCIPSCSSFMKPHNHHSVTLPSTIKPFPVQLPASDIPHPGCGIWLWFWFIVLLCWGFNPEPHCSSTGTFLMIPEDVNRISVRCNQRTASCAVLFKHHPPLLFQQGSRSLGSPAVRWPPDVLASASQHWNYMPSFYIAAGNQTSILCLCNKDGTDWAISSALWRHFMSLNSLWGANNRELVDLPTVNY